MRSGSDVTMTSSVARRGGCSSFMIAELIGADRDSSGRNHDNNNNSSSSRGCEVRRWSAGDCRDIDQADCQRQVSTGAFHVYRPASVASANFYQACLNWMRARGTTQRSLDETQPSGDREIMHTNLHTYLSKTHNIHSGVLVVGLGLALGV